MADFASAPSGLLLPGNHKERNDVRLSLPASFVAVLSAAILAAEASAQTPEQFYTGKTIDFVIGYPPGGSNTPSDGCSPAISASTSRESPRSCRRISPAPAASWR
jgi:hypothetical protein